MRVTILGAGYVGLVSGACFADFGNDVVCVDKDPSRAAKLRAGQSPIYEPGLDALLAENIAAGRLSFERSGQLAVAQADVIFIAVGTPARRGDGHADLTYIFKAAEEIADWISGFTVIVTKSTVPVGTGDEVAKIIRERRPDSEFAVVSNPEFLREGAAIADFKHPDRIVVGSDDSRATEIMRELYRPLVGGGAQMLVVSRRTAELTKYAANAFLAMKITFINEMANLCDAVGADVEEVATGMGLDNRIGPKFLKAGPGYGGSCFPKDTLALVRTAREAGQPIELIETTVRVNQSRKLLIAHRILAALRKDPSEARIGLLGVTFKPDTDDVRDSPALEIAEALIEEGVKVVAYDPQGLPAASAVLPKLALAEDAYSAAQDADLLVLATEWDEFRALDLRRIKDAMKTPALFDLRNVYSPATVMALGFAYRDIGRTNSAEDLAYVSQTHKHTLDIDAVR